MRFGEDYPKWADSHFFSSANERDRAIAKVSKHRTAENIAKAKRLRNSVTAIKRNLQHDYFRQAFESAGKDNKKLWSVIKLLTGQKSKNNRINEISGTNDDKAMANNINTFFSDIGPNLAAKIPDSLLDVNYDRLPHLEPFELNLCTLSEIKELIMNILDCKSTGNDGIPVRFSKCNLVVISSLILHIINLSILSKKVPSCWKSVTLTPLHKEGDKTDPADYRPISILPVISKVLERVVHKQLYKYLSDNKVLSDAQLGFRKGYSTSTCVLNLVDTIFHNMSQGQLTGAQESDS